MSFKSIEQNLAQRGYCLKKDKWLLKVKTYCDKLERPENIRTIAKNLKCHWMTVAKAVWRLQYDEQIGSTTVVFPKHMRRMLAKQK